MVATGPRRPLEYANDIVGESGATATAWGAHITGLLRVVPAVAAAMALCRARPTLGRRAPLLGFAILAVGWALVFGIGLQLVPHEGASSPYGGLGLIAMFSGFFIMMGFIWSVIGE